MTGLYRAVAVVSMVALCGGTAAAESPRRPAPQARTGKPARAPAAKAATTAAPQVALATEGAGSAVPAAVALAAPVTSVKPAAVPTANALMVTYQRVGRELMLLQGFRGTDCTLDLWPTFRAIKLDVALATPEARAQTAATLAEIQGRIDRKRGISVRKECLDNPLAPECL
jgi:hypothetical protein